MTGREITIAAYVLIVVAVAALELASRREWASVLTFGDAMTKVARSPFGRAVLLALWWWVGWHFLARSGPPL